MPERAFAPYLALENKLHAGRPKCPGCGLVNFADAAVCKRCGANLSAPPTQLEASPLLVETSSPQPAQRYVNPNLFPCSDCGHMVSRQAEACPQCGRFFQRFSSPRKGDSSLTTVLAGILFLVSIGVSLMGLATLYGPEKIVGGDAYNYIIAGSRGTGLLIVALCFLMLAVGLDIRAEIIKSRS